MELLFFSPTHVVRNVLKKRNVTTYLALFPRLVLPNDRGGEPRQRIPKPYLDILPGRPENVRRARLIEISKSEQAANVILNCRTQFVRELRMTEVRGRLPVERLALLLNIDAVPLTWDCRNAFEIDDNGIVQVQKVLRTCHWHTPIGTFPAAI